MGPTARSEGKARDEPEGLRLYVTRAAGRAASAGGPR
jgi:hypothetical protein